MRAVLIKIWPYDPATDTRVPVCLSSINDRVNAPRINAMGGNIWAPCLTALPTLSIEVFNGDFKAAVQTGNASFGFNIALLAQSYPGVEAMVWARAPVEIYGEHVDTALPWAPRFVGKVETFSLRGLTMTLCAKVDEEPFSVDVLTQTYAGTTGAEGPADLKNRAKPLVIGWAQNVEPVLINATDSVYQFSAYGPIEAVNTLYERGAANLGTAFADYANYAALVAATIPPGRYATCLAEGMIRLGAPAYGVITADIKGHRVGLTTPRLTGQIISALASIAGVSSSLLLTSSLDAMDANKPYPIGLVLTEQTDLLEIAQNLALACNHQCGVSLLGQLFVTRPNLAASASMAVNANGSTWPQVAECSEESASAPYWRTTMGANKSWRVHTADEIAFTAELIEKGGFNAAETYREGNIVVLDDGSRWVYVNGTPTSGNSPPAWPTTSNTWWENLSPPTARTTIGGPLPSVADSQVGDIHIGDDGTYYVRVNSGGILLDGKAVTLAGFRPQLAWTKASSQPLYDASQTASTAEQLADQALSAIADLADDGLISVNEKVVTLIPENSRLEGAWSALSAAAATAGVSTTAASTKRTAWITLRNSLTPAWNDITQDTPVTRATFRAALVEYDQALEDLNKAVIEGMTAAKQVTVAPPSDVTIYCDQAGTPKSGVLPVVLTPVVLRGGADIRTSNDATYSISAPSQVDASVNNTTGSADKGRITIGTSWTGPGTISLTVTVSGIPYGPFPIALSRQNDPPSAPTGGGGSGPAYDSTFNAVNSTSFVAISDELGPLTITSGQNLVVTAPLDYNLSATARTSRYMVAKAQYWDGSAWQDFPSSPVNGSNATWSTIDFSGDPGSINLSQTKTGLAAGSYKVRLVAALSASGASAVLSVTSGTMTYSIT